MLQGVLPENQQQASELLNQAQLFLQELFTYYTEQTKLLMGQAQAETQYISAYVDTIGLKNIEHSIQRLQTLTSKNDPRAAEKCLQYLQRTAEFLLKISQNSQDGADFIPVPYHKKVAAEHQVQLASCQALIARANLVITPSPAQAKSWFSRFLNFANILPDIRAAAYGLPKAKHQAASERLQAIHTNLLTLDAKKDTDQLVTKTSRKALGINGFNDVPSADSDYHQLVPPLEHVMFNFKAFMAKQKLNQDVLTKEAVFEAVATPFPKPVMK